MERIMLITAPVTSRSGYGDHARDLVRAFIKHDKYDINIFDVPWGETPRNALDSELDKNIIFIKKELCIFYLRNYLALNITNLKK